MSRTIRRKNGYQKYSHVDYFLSPHLICGYLFDWDEWHYTKKYSGCTKDKVRKILESKFHSDSHPGERTPPSWYCHFLDKKVKSRNKMELINIIKYMEFDEMDFVGTPYMKDAGWSWW
jgi:hypothetical protein